jgi:hypothetical protein
MKIIIQKRCLVPEKTVGGRLVKTGPKSIKSNNLDLSELSFGCSSQIHDRILGTHLLRIVGIRCRDLANFVLFLIRTSAIFDYYILLSKKAKLYY